MSESNLNTIYDLIISYAPKAILAILTLIIGFWLIGKITKAFERILTGRDVDVTLRPFLKSAVSVILKVLLLLSVAGMFGIETTSFIAIFSAAAFAIGIALQGSLSHFASGVLILLFKPYKVGDLVELGGKVGVVESIQVFNTVILTPDNKKVIIPNGLVTSNVITNISGQGTIRVDMTYGISYSTDIDKAKKVISEVVNSCEHVLKDRPVDIFVSKHNSSSVDFVVRPWTKSEHFWDVNFYVQENLKKAFDKNNISIPFPQMDVHLIKEA